MNVVALSNEELLRLLAAARAYRERDFVMLLVGFCHGCRRSEVLAIVRDDLADDHISIQRRKRGPKLVQPLVHHSNPLLDEATALLKYARNKLGNQKLFPIGPKQFWRIFQKHGKTAGIPAFKCHPHTLRHTMGTDIYERDKDLAAVQAYLGHVSPASSLIYARKSSQQAAAIVQEVVKNI
jgi:integrase